MNQWLMPVLCFAACLFRGAPRTRVLCARRSDIQATTFRKLFLLSCTNSLVRYTRPPQSCANPTHLYAAEVTAVMMIAPLNKSSWELLRFRETSGDHCQTDCP